MKRFYREVSLSDTAEGHRVLLDGRPVKTQGGRAQAVPSRPLATAMAAEWADQGDDIDPTRFFMRDLADYAIDVVAPDPAATRATLIGFAETDTLCYRAYPDEPFAARQQTDWEPLVTAAEARLDVRFVRVAGVIHRPQPPETLARLRAQLDTHDSFALAGLHTLTSLAASLIIGLAALGSATTIDALWDAANLEELWQAELWGKVPEAEARRAHRYADFTAAARFAALANNQN